LTLLVFNIEDIYLFISKLASTDNGEEQKVNLKRDYICVANSDLFELRLLINDEKKLNDIQQKDKPKSPLLDIKIRSNLIQLRTCVDSAFALIELINYIVSDGDLHKPVCPMSEFMASNPFVYSVPAVAGSKSNLMLERQSSQNLADEMTSAINQEHNDAEMLLATETSCLINRSYYCYSNKF